MIVFKQMTANRRYPQPTRCIGRRRRNAMSYLCPRSEDKARCSVVKLAELYVRYLGKSKYCLGLD